MATQLVVIEHDTKKKHNQNGKNIQILQLLRKNNWSWPPCFVKQKLPDTSGRGHSVTGASGADLLRLWREKVGRGELTLHQENPPAHPRQQILSL